MTVETSAQYFKRTAERQTAENKAVFGAVAELVKDDPLAFFNISANGKTYIGGNGRSPTCIENGGAEGDLALSIADEIARESHRGLARQFTLGADVDGKPMTAVVCTGNQVMYADLNRIMKERFARTGDHLSV